MTISFINSELDRAEQAVSKGQFDEALQILGNLEERNVFSPDEHLRYQFIKATLKSHQGKHNEAFELAEAALNISQELDKPLQRIKALNLMIWTCWRLGKFDEALQFSEKGENLFKTLDHDQSSEMLSNKAIFLSHKGLIYVNKGDLDQALKFSQQALQLRLQIGKKREIVHSYNNIGVAYEQKGMLNQSLKCYQKALVVVKETDDIRSTGVIYANIGNIYRLKGEQDSALENLEQSMKILRKLGVEEDYLFNFLGLIYRQKGEWKQALTYFQRSLALRKCMDHKANIAETYMHLISLSLEQGSLDQATQYLQELEVIQATSSNKIIDQRYRLAKIMILKTDEKTRDTLSFVTLHHMLNKYVTSQHLLQVLIAEPIVDHEVTVEAIFNLCELLLVELKTFGNKDVLDEVNQLTQRLVQIGQAQNSFALLTKTYFLMSKLALLEPDVARAQELLIQAQQMAEEKGYNRFALVLTQEQKKLTGQLPVWLSDEKTSLLERLNQIQLESLVISLRQDRVESYTYELPSAPTMQDLKAFTSQLSRQKFEW